MAYVALTSLKTTIELHFLQPIPRVSFPDDDQTPPIYSFYENLSSLQAFLENKSSVGGGAAIKHFETILRDFALKVEDEIEMQVSNFVVAKAKDDDTVHQEAAFQQLCQILQQALEKTTDVVEIINSLKRQNDDLTYLQRIIDHHIKSSSIQSNARREVYDQIPTLFKSLIQTLSSLRHYIIGAPAAAIRIDFETKIHDLAVDDIKIQLSSFLLAKDTVHEEEAFQEWCQTLQQGEEMRVELINKEKERQKTCGCCDDLINLLRRLMDHGYLRPSSSTTPSAWVPDDLQTQLESLHQNLFALQEFVLKSKFGGSRAEIQIRHFVIKAKEDIKTQFRNFCVAKEEHRLPNQASEQLFQTLHQVAENAAQLLSTIHNTRSNDPKLEEGRIMVGRQNDVSFIKNRLFSRFHGVNVVPIIGMPGIGKTTLARKILKDQSIALNFQVRGWATVTQNYNKTKVLRDLLQSISPNHEIIKKVPLCEQVRECLKGKRYLIVLDDIWSTQHWDELQYFYSNSAVNGSCILLTTRFYGVADHACTIKGTHHVMSLLNPNESWDLFCTIFPLQRYRAPSFGKFRSDMFHVVEICEGLPQSIVVVAKRLSECKTNIQHELKKIEKEIELLGILDYSALILMYNQLPEYLKGCFLYLGVFPKRSEIQVKILLRLWIAEGFVKPSENKELERIAYCYLKDLINTSLVLISKQTLDGKIKTCRVHSVMHNICFREAQKEGILCAVNTRLLPRWSLNAFANSCRWLSLCKHSFDYYVLFSLNNPRSIFFFQENTEIFVSFKLLRVLAFVPSSFFQRVPMHVGDLVFLRYLSVTQWFEGLSDVLSRNVNLQTLIVSGSDNESQVGAPTLHLPSTIWESPQLRHIELDTSYTVNPPSMVKENLQTLSWVAPAPTHCKKTVYSNFPNIKILKIFYKVDLEASQISGSSSNCFILDKLDYLGRLKSLTISVSVGCIVSLPEKCIFPLQLKKLKLSDTNLSGRDLTVIGMLQWLEVLKLENALHEKVWKVAEGGFYRLRLLVLKDKKLERLEAYTDSFPCLEHLVLKCCECLEEISSSFGEIFCFKSIEMDRFSHRPSIVASARDIQEKLKKNFGKENFEIKIQGQGQGPEECVEDVEKANSEIKMEEGESSAGGRW
ncbi:putative late blight resistance protein homolog R1B-17 isoform X2 [Ipomoea triloba]|uniref:putative late blight resistance protein homolog R1B-17 isoform X2 n=1 Tax=Ipomoea triloba TaxID=35885 RepID=UPI00125D0DE3|nr:putative late blight resistance protein homolog R1B-17 isoform X2 [Ipomoea triloba]